MAKKSKVGLKVPTANEMAKKYGSMIKLASEVTDTDLYIPSTFFALNYLFGKGIPYGKIVEIAEKNPLVNLWWLITLLMLLNNLEVM